ncbi:MAG: DolP-mannose mannosyltransferase [Halorientalis sp.]
MGEYEQSVTRSQREVYDWIDANWFPVILGGATLLLTVATLYEFAENPWYIHKDSALFQHAGWYIGQGAHLYVDIWDLKPPLIYAVSTLLAFLSFGNMHLLHVYGIVVAVAAMIAGVTLTGVITHRLTDDGFASVVAAASIFVVTSTYLFPYAGIRPKYLAFCCSAAALLLAIEDRPLYSGIAAALAAGFWQLGALVGFLVVAMAYDRSGRPGMLRAIAGGVAVAVATVLPFVLAGDATALFVEVVLGPIYGVVHYTIPGRLLRTVIELGWGILLIPLGVYAWGRALAADYRRYWWLAVGGGLYLLQLFLEFQGAIELILLVLFLALGVGVLVAEIDSRSRRVLVACGILLLVGGSLYWNAASVTPVKDSVEAQYDHWDVPDYPSLPADPAGWPSMQAIYWGKLQPRYCNYRLGDKQKYFQQQTDGSLYKRQCGQWPYDESPVAWIEHGFPT